MSLSNLHMGFSAANTLCLAGLFLSGCFTSHSVVDECEAVRACFPTDREGCCGETSLSVSVCEACPGGYAEREECPTVGCVGCAGDALPASEADPIATLSCYPDLGAGCCGAEVMWVGDSCGGGAACPVGTVPAEVCAGFGDACACPDGEPAGDRFGIRPPDLCRVDHGSGCCGDYVERTVCGDCPRGSVPEFECTAALGGDGPSGDGGASGYPADAPSDCFEDLGDGCCGAPMGLINICGTCSAGTIARLECRTDDICPPFG